MCFSCGYQTVIVLCRPPLACDLRKNGPSEGVTKMRTKAFLQSGQHALCAVAAMLCISSLAKADIILSSCGACDGSKFGLAYSLDSDNGTTSIFDITLLADTSGNTLAASAYNAVAIGINLPAGASLLSALEAAPNGAANWTPQTGGISSGGGGGCNGSGAFICAQTNSAAFAATTPNASTATTPYEWVWEVAIPDSVSGGPSSVFTSSSDVKVNYTTINGHHVSDTFTFQNGDPTTQAAVPEPASMVLLGSALCFLAARCRHRLPKV